jgi:hypothetical protein
MINFDSKSFLRCDVLTDLKAEENDNDVQLSMD